MDSLHSGQAGIAQYLDIIPNAILISDDAGSILAANELAENLFGYPHNALVGLSINRLLPELLDLHHYWHEQRVLENNQALTAQGPRVCEATTSNGTHIPVELMFRLIQTGTTSNVLTEIHDLSHQPRLQPEIERQLRELSDTNHELLNTIQTASRHLNKYSTIANSYFQFLARRYDWQLDKETGEFTEYIVHTYLRMQEITKRLQTYSHFVANDLHLAEVDLNEILAHVIENLHGLIVERNVEIKNETLPTLVADRIQMIELFRHLLNNAIAFNDSATPTIGITHTEIADEHVCAIEDNGIGIDPRHQESIFLPFQRLYQALNNTSTGIGLTLCKIIVRRHHGRLWLASLPGTGSTFFFALPKHQRHDKYQINTYPDSRHSTLKH